MIREEEILCAAAAGLVGAVLHVILNGIHKKNNFDKRVKTISQQNGSPRGVKYERRGAFSSDGANQKFLLAQTQMTKGESISGLLEAAHVQRRQGMLHVEYSQGGCVEAGDIYLRAGEPTYARVGSLTGNEALHYLLGWRDISFAFFSDGPRPPANIASGPTIKRTNASIHSVSPTFAVSPQELKKGLMEERVVAVSNHPTLLDMIWFVPRKASQTPNALLLPLTRRQRLIYFLVDGRRTVGDLMRMTSKNIMDVKLILHELQEQGLVIV